MEKALTAASQEPLLQAPHPYFAVYLDECSSMVEKTSSFCHSEADN